jgi:hypothetical protein
MDLASSKNAKMCGLTLSVSRTPICILLLMPFLPNLTDVMGNLFMYSLINHLGKIETPLPAATNCNMISVASMILRDLGLQFAGMRKSV